MSYCRIVAYENMPSITIIIFQYILFVAISVLYLFNKNDLTRLNYIVIVIESKELRGLASLWLWIEMDDHICRHSTEMLRKSKTFDSSSASKNEYFPRIKIQTRQSVLMCAYAFWNPRTHQIVFLSYFGYIMP